MEVICFGFQDTGLSQPETVSLTVCPNPASDYFRVESAKKIDRVWLTNLSGQVLKIVEGGEANQIQVPVRGMEKGVYMLVVDGEGRSQRAKVIIK